MIMCQRETACLRFPFAGKKPFRQKSSHGRKSAVQGAFLRRMSPVRRVFAGFEPERKSLWDKTCWDSFRGQKVPSGSYIGRKDLKRRCAPPGGEPYGDFRLTIILKRAMIRKMACPIGNTILHGSFTHMPFVSEEG